jgi:hypothetical protein
MCEYVTPRVLMMSFCCAAISLSNSVVVISIGAPVVRVDDVGV